MVGKIFLAAVLKPWKGQTPHERRNEEGHLHVEMCCGQMSFTQTVKVSVFLCSNNIPKHLFFFLKKQCFWNIISYCKISLEVSKGICQKVDAI